MKAVHQKSQMIIARDVMMADQFFDRLQGLMFKPSLESGKGLLITPCNSIHTFFMRFPIDVIFLDGNNGVVKIIKNLKPWRMTKIYFSSRKTLELPAGQTPIDLKEGDYVEFTHV
jgi:uncharacterized protein